jgi:hypothetical protein
MYVTIQKSADLNSGLVRFVQTDEWMNGALFKMRVLLKWKKSMMKEMKRREKGCRNRNTITFFRDITPCDLS